MAQQDQNIWKPKSVEENLKLYGDWADSYDADVAKWGYATPGRIASALAELVGDKATPILDFGCGTGVSGVALKSFGFTTLDGTDISEDMLEHARGTDIYRRVWRGEPGEISATPGDYAAVVAAGVISLGAAPPETLAQVLQVLAPGGLAAFSFNDPTLKDDRYPAALRAAIDTGAVLRHEDYGDHLPGKGMNSMVYILEKT